MNTKSIYVRLLNIASAPLETKFDNKNQEIRETANAAADLIAALLEENYNLRRTQ